MYENNLNAVFTFSEAPSNYRGMKTEWPGPLLGTTFGHEDQPSYNPIYMYLGFPPAISISIPIPII